MRRRRERAGNGGGGKASVEQGVGGRATRASDEMDDEREGRVADDVRRGDVRNLKGEREADEEELTEEGESVREDEGEGVMAERKEEGRWVERKTSGPPNSDFASWIWYRMGGNKEKNVRDRSPQLRRRKKGDPERGC